MLLDIIAVPAAAAAAATATMLIRPVGPIVSQQREASDFLRALFHKHLSLNGFV